MGRPPKFEEARRPVTLTLPYRTLDKLAAIAPDRAQAIVKAVDAVVSDNQGEHPLVEFIEIGSGQSLIVVGPSSALNDIPGLRLIEIAPCRFLLSIPTGTPIEKLEVAVLDLLEQLPAEEKRERSLLSAIRESLTVVRREQRVTKAEILVISRA